MGATTEYRVKLIYAMHGTGAIRGMANLQRQTSSTTSAIRSLRNALTTIFVGNRLFSAGKKYLYDYNTQIEQMKIGLGTIIGMNLQVPFQKGAAYAEKMFASFQKMAIQSPATTKDFIVMANDISSAVLSSGKSLKDLETMTAGAVTAAAALGAATDEAQRGMFARDVAQMTRGQIRSVDRYAIQLLRGVGYDDYKKFNSDVRSKKVNAADVTMRALTTPQIQGASDAFAKSTGGVMSTFRDMVEITLGKVGLPLMQAMTAEVQKWNTYMIRNPEKMEKFVRGMSDGLRSAAKFMRDMVVGMMPIIKSVFGVVGAVVRFVSEHRDMLIGVMKAMLVYKAASFVGGAGQRLIGMGATGYNNAKTLQSAWLGTLKTTTGATATLGQRFMTVGAALPGVGTALAVFGTALFAAADFLFGETQSEKERRQKRERELNSPELFVTRLDEWSTANKKLRKAGISRDEKNPTKYAQELINEEATRREAVEMSYTAFLNAAEAYNVSKTETFAGQIEKTHMYDNPRAAGIDPTTPLGKGWGKFEGNLVAQTLQNIVAKQAPAIVARLQQFHGEELGIPTLRADIAAFETSLASKGYADGPAWDKYYNNQVRLVSATEQLSTLISSKHVTTGIFNGGTQITFGRPLAGPTEDGSPLTGNETGTVGNMSAKGNRDINVTINTIEVASEDPDRFVHNMIGSFTNIARNPTQAKDAMRGGF